MKRVDRELREKKVLEIIVQSYITTGVPISSRLVSLRLNLSSATIRNIMADLEEIGLIRHPHTSAGRIPTDVGYRYYVDSLMHLKRIAEDHIRQIELEYRSKVKSLEDILEKTARILSRFTGCAGVTLLAEAERKYIRYINLVPLTGRRILALLVAQSGFVKDYIIELEHPLDEDLLRRVANFLNREFHDAALEDIKNILVKRLQAERDSSYKMVNAAYEIVKAALMRDLEEKFYYNGTSYILGRSEFSGKERSREILRFFEERQVISNILHEDLYEDKLKIRIGGENKTFGLDDFSIITAGFKVMNEASGRLGIIGPVRMDYDRAIPLVDLLAGTVTRVLS